MDLQVVLERETDGIADRCRADSEFDLLEALARKPGVVRSKTELLDAVWGHDFDGELNVVEVYAGYLRRKIDAPFGRSALQTVRGAGYRLAADGG